FVPAGKEAPTCHRIRYLNPVAAHYAVFVHSADGFEDPANPRDYTNLSTRLEPFRQAAPLDTRIADILSIDGVEQIARPDGTVFLAVRGLDFGRIVNGLLEFGFAAGNSRDKPRLARNDRDFQEAEALARGIARMRSVDADRGGPLYAMHPEAWLESQVRANIE